MASGGAFGGLEIARLCLTGLTLALAVYAIARPERILAKHPALTAPQLRALLGLAILLMVLPTGAALVFRGKPATQPEGVARFEAFFRGKLAKIPAAVQSDALTRACVAETIPQIQRQMPSLPNASAELAALANCACVVAEVIDLSETKRARDLVAEGLPQSTAFERAYGKVPDLQKRLAHCSN